jgi:hypothetical protein
MGDLAGDSLTTYKQKQEEYSADAQKSVYQQHQTNDIYVVNLFLFFIYYGFLIYYTYYTYGTFRYSTLYYKKLFMLMLLFAYPFIVYPLQYGVYNVGKFIVNLAYNNVYDTKSW